MNTITQKSKPLKPTMRDNRRYILYEVSAQKALDKESVARAIQKRAQEFLGELGLAKSNLKVLKDTWNNDTQRGIVCVNHTHVDEARTVLMTITNDVTIRTIRTSGVINKLKAEC